MLAVLLGPTFCTLGLGASSLLQKNPESLTPTPAMLPAARRHGGATILGFLTTTIERWIAFGLKLLLGHRLFLALYGSISGCSVPGKSNRGIPGKTGKEFRDGSPGVPSPSRPTSCLGDSDLHPNTALSDNQHSRGRRGWAKIR